MNRLDKITGVLKKWWLVLIIGIISVILGINILVNPAIGFETVRLIIVIDFIAMGITELVAVITFRREIPAWGWNLVAAALDVILGVFIAAVPGLSESLLLALFSVGFVFEGIMVLSGAFALKSIHVKGWGWNLALGILTIIVGFACAANPIISFMAIGTIAGITMLVVGCALTVLSIRMSKAKALIDRKIL